MDKLEKYILEHTSPEDDVLKELYRQTHLKTLFPRMLSGHLQGQLLQMLTKMINPQTALEIGTFTGYSAICIARGLQEGSILHTIERNDELESFAQNYFDKTGLTNRIVLHIGDAVDIIPEIEGSFELVFIDGDKRCYKDYYHTVFPKVKNGGYIIADNILWYEKVVKAIPENDTYTKGILEFNDLVQTDERVENLIIPIRDGLMVARKK